MAQLGWLIDLNRCIGCNSCTIACKSENNTRPLLSPLPFKNGRGVLPDAVNYRWVVTKESGVYPNPLVTFITSACNHCQFAACMASCPLADVNTPDDETQAIFKRNSDGVVLINQDVCIGCRNCVQACPYGAPQFNAATNKAEKCTMCIHRLYDGSGSPTGFEPACVTTCVGNALRFVADFAEADAGANAPPGFADPTLTKPSVKFVPRQP